MVPALVLLGLVVATAARPGAPPWSWWGLSGHRNGVLSVAVAVAVLWLVAIFTAHRPDRVRTLVTTLGATGAVVAALVLVEGIGIDVVPPPGVEGPDVGPTGALGNASTTGTALAATLPLLVWWRSRLDADGPRRLAAVAVAVVAVVAVVVLEARAAIVFLPGGVGLLGLLDTGTMSRRWARSLLTTSAVLVVGAGAFFVVGSFAQLPTMPFSVTSASSFDDRVAMWDGAIGVVGEHPLLGAGPTGFVRPSRTRDPPTIDRPPSPPTRHQPAPRPSGDHRRPLGARRGRTVVASRS
ncbi:MAG: O-antigen ligase family protein [Acidimicrobiia bacterium]|nr:O-antigen ligase family protein [Acidimicrobiia bacterium]